MADCIKLTVFNTTGAFGTWTAGAASFTAPLGEKGDSRAVLMVDNRNTDIIVRVNLDAGDGMLSCLGDLNVDIAASSIGAVPLGESMRFKVGSTGKVTVNLHDTADTTLTAGPLGNIKVALIQG